MGDNKIFMEPEEYEAYLAAQKQLNETTPDEKLLNESESNSGVVLYTMNRSIIAQNFPHADENKIKQFRSIITKWLEENDANYYMLLNNELHYYTIFKFDPTGTYEHFNDELIDVFKYVGPIRDIHVDNNGAIAIWADWNCDKDDTLPHCFYLFNYDKGVVEING